MGSRTSSSHISPRGGAGVGLPAPKVQTYENPTQFKPEMADGQPSVGAVLTLVTENYVLVTVPGLPETILQNLDLYKPQVELLRYTTASNKRSVTTNLRQRKKGYVHPSHGPAPSGNGSHTHGGSQEGVAQSIRDLRPTEWPITGPGFSVDVTQGMYGFMTMTPVFWRDTAGNYAFELLPVPSSSATRKTLPGARFPYSATFQPGYFMFRISVIDTSDPRGRRIHGPLSERVSLTTAEFPFVPEGVDALGRAACSITPFLISSMNFWIGASSRLPS